MVRSKDKQSQLVGVVSMEGDRLTVSRLYGFSGNQKAGCPCVYLDVPGPSVSSLSTGSHHTPRRAAEHDGTLWWLGAYRKGELVRKPGKMKMGTAPVHSAPCTRPYVWRLLFRRDKNLIYCRTWFP